MQVSKDIRWVGVNDRDIDLFEAQYRVPNGMAYNSYIVFDEKIAVFDSVDGKCKDEWLNNLQVALNGKTPDYLIVQHMEPDHSANIVAFINEYPTAKIVATDKAFIMMKNYFGVDFSDRRVVVTDGATLALGKRNLRFFTAPMVHWPEVMVTYDELSKTLFSADAFGKFGATDIDEDWACEARRYYFGIVGKYGAQVQSLLKKLEPYKIERICALHGPVLTENLGYYLDLYNTWSSYGVESDGVLIAYTSVYGNTKKAVGLLEQELVKNGCKKVVVADLARDDMSETIEDAFRYGKIVLATTTYNGDIFPFMHQFIQGLKERNFQNRTVAFMENGSWAPMATRVMQGMLENCKNLQYTQETVKILSSVKQETVEQIQRLAKELCK